MNKSFIILISAVISLAIYFLLPVDKVILKGLAILIFVAVLWFTEALPITVTALLVPILAVLTGIFGVKEALSHFANPVIFLFMGGFALAAALHKHSLDRLIASYIMKAAGANSLLSVLGLFVSTAFISMWISNTATAAIMLPVALGLIANLRESSTTTEEFILLGVAYSASIGGIGTLVGSPPNAITAANLGMDFRDWLGIGIPFVLILMPIIVLILYLVLRPKLLKGTVLDLSGLGQIAIDKNTYKLAAIFGVTVLLWIFSGPVSSRLGIEKEFDSIVAILAIFMLVVSGTIKWKEIERFTDWGVLLLFGGGLLLSALLSETGASKYLADLVRDHLSIHGPFPLMLGAVLFVIFLTEFASNTATAAIMVPIFLALGQETMRHSPDAIALSVGIAASCAFMLPVATPPNALVFGTEKIRQRTMIKAGFYLNIVCGIVITIVSYYFF
ncbi:MAG TPA: SLC13 family permease [Thermodesulfobacteriota bacterium]|nr:SLC13 family permease [Thermodesulfobacteriota bacterium]